MISLTLAQMRRSLGRLLAAGIAILIGTAFVTTTLLASSLIERASVDALTARFADADLVVTGELSVDAAEAIIGIDGVAASHASATSFVQLSGTGPSIGLPVSGAATDPALRALELVDGEVPQTDEIALPADVAQRLGAEIGDGITVIRSVWEPASPDTPASPDMPSDGGWIDGDWIERPEQLLLVGLLEDPAGAFSMTGGTALVAPDQAVAWLAESWPPEESGAHLVDEVTVLVEPDASLDKVRERIVEVAGGGLWVRTRDEVAASTAEEMTGEANVLTALGLGFAAIALIVAGLVISNTFQVLVAQRTRSLALLRCVGATARQLRRSVTVEALLLGVGSSVAGIAFGSLLAQVALLILRRTAGGAGLPATVELDLVVVLVPLITGTVVAWFASIAPARAASRVAPLAAMRPSEAPSAGARSGQVRLVFALLLVVMGAVLLGIGMVVGTSADIMLGLLIGIPGGLLSFVGVLVGAVFWVPRVIGAMAGLVSRGSRPATTLAASNSLRNPRRTAATSSALLIGVTLVAMMSTGASTARASFEQEFDRTYPVDVAVESYAAAFGAGATGGVQDLDPAQVTEIAALDGVAETITLGRAPLRIVGEDGFLDLDGLVADPSEVLAVVRDTDAFARLDDDTVLVPRHLAAHAGMEAGDVVEVAPVDPERSEVLATPRELTVQIADLDGVVLISTSTGAQLAPDAAATTVWLRLDADVDAARIVGDIQEIVQDTPVGVISPASERASFEQIVSTLLAVVLALLGVAVVIALVGVANTLSLSVIERRRESATLRAIGLTRRQLRQTLAVESLFIAGAGTLLGVLLGTFYGYVGARTVLGSMAEGIPLSVPWRDLGLVLAVSLIAGMVASILPARSAARTPPVAALATE